MTYASSSVRQVVRLVTQVLITAVAIAATVLFTCALRHSAAGTSHSGHTPTQTPTAPVRVTVAD